MDLNRREFIKTIGIASALGLLGGRGFELLAPGELEAKVLPASKRKQWAMVIDMPKCIEKNQKEQCQECIKACHTLHNVPDFGDPKVEIKWIWKEKYEHTFPGTHHEFTSEAIHGKDFIVLCNHCTNPPCVRVCPTKATWQRPDGIVMMDWHRCIGCRFCMAACPFGARSFNWGDPRKCPPERNPGFPTNMAYPTRSKGVVEKCTFCPELLSKGELPACVQACKKIKVEALIFGDLSDPESEVRQILKEKYTLRRKPELGTAPKVFYII